MRYCEKSPITGESILVRVENVLGDHNPEMSAPLLSARTIACLTRLFGEPAVLFKDKADYRPPGCRPDKRHQDQAAGGSAYADLFISMCIAVDENREDNAAMSFMRSGNYEKRLMGKEWCPLCEDDPPARPEGQYALIEADPGDVIFFASCVAHGSPANTGAAGATSFSPSTGAPPATCGKGTTGTSGRATRRADPQAGESPARTAGEAGARGRLFNAPQTL